MPKYTVRATVPCTVGLNFDVEAEDVNTARELVIGNPDKYLSNNFDPVSFNWPKVITFPTGIQDEDFEEMEDEDDD